MGRETAIGWTQATWNPWRGCTRLSPGCAHCYMFSGQRRYGRDPDVVVRAAPGTFRAPLHWQPRMIFTCSWSDWFHPDADKWRDEAWDVIRRCPRHIFQILTKRPERIANHLPADWGTTGWPNVWLGTSVESQRYVWRAEVLARIPAVVRFISAEPLLGRVDLTLLLDCDHGHMDGAEGPIDELGRFPYVWRCRGCGVLADERAQPLHDRSVRAIDWVIAGGESGPHCRPCDERWLRSLRDQCKENGVAYYLKQLGGHPDKHQHESAVLDGRTWTEMPTPRPTALLEACP